MGPNVESKTVQYTVHYNSNISGSLGSGKRSVQRNQPQPYNISTFDHP